MYVWKGALLAQLSVKEPMQEEDEGKKENSGNKFKWQIT